MGTGPDGSRPSVTRENFPGGEVAVAGAAVVRVDCRWVVESVEDHLGVFGEVKGLVGRDLREARAEVAGGVVGQAIAVVIESGRVARVEGREERLGVWVEVSAWPAEGGEGAVAYIVDVTRRREAEEECERLRAAAGAKDDFLAVVSHELRTPLTPVLMAASLLEKDLTLSPAAREEAGVIRRNVELEARLIDDLLDLNRLALGKMPVNMQWTDVHSAIGHALHVAREEILAKRLWLRMDLSATRHVVRADPVRLQQVFWNLLKNAVKFTPEGGTVIVRSRTAGGPGKDEVVRVEVQDTGVGIEPGSLSRIFAMFEQVREAGMAGNGDGAKAAMREPGGLGLGLAICRALVELHAGRVWAESAGPGRGATFVVELPVAGVETATSGGPSHDGQVKKAADIARRLAILVVEDHGATAAMLSRVLEGLGHEVSTAASLGEASRVAVEGKFDLLISDLGLPDGSGLDLMERVRKEVPGMRGIALSGYGMDGDVRRSEAAGFAAHLIKPVAVAELAAAITRVTEEK